MSENLVDEWRTVYALIRYCSLQHLIWVQVCTELSVWILMVNIVTTWNKFTLASAASVSFGRALLLKYTNISIIYSWWWNIRSHILRWIQLQGRSVRALWPQSICLPSKGGYSYEFQNNGPDQVGHVHNLIRSFSVCFQTFWMIRNPVLTWHCQWTTVTHVMMEK